YSRPAQCSPLRRSIVDRGWATARSSATDGVDIVLNFRPDLVLRQAEMLEDGVTAGSRARGQHHGLDELFVGQSDVTGRHGQPVLAQAVDDLLEPLGVLPQEKAEGGADPGQLSVVGRTGEKLIH